MTVADLEQRALRMHGKVERRSRDKLLVVEVPTVNPWGSAVDLSDVLRRRDADAAEKWVKRNLDPRSELRDHPAPVERDDLHPRVRKILGQVTPSRTETVVRVRNGEIDPLDANLQDVARL